MFDFNTPIDKFPPLRTHKAKLRKIGVETLGGLFYYLPRRYDDYSKIARVADLNIGEAATIFGQIESIKNIYTRNKMILTEAIIRDESGSIMAMWFNQPYLLKSLPKGSRVSMAGRPALSRKGLYFPNPVYEKLSVISYKSSVMIHTGRLVPVYPETKGVSSRWLRYVIFPLLYIVSDAKDFLPLEIIRKEKLSNLASALRQAHFPNSSEAAEKARRRLSFDEAFLIQLSALKQRKDWNKNFANPIAFHEKITKKFTASLPFKLTNAQRVASWEIIQDMQKDKPMNRLLNGDVGSGKTLVASIAALQAVLNGQQVAMMAPTEILARQHYKTLCDLFDQYGIKCGLLTKSPFHPPLQKGERGGFDKKSLLKEIESGEINLTIGTHALIQDKVKFKNLALVIIDEQHRFGVNQRASLQNKIHNSCFVIHNSRIVPHLLSMTATPIPRTLALTIYGDLDISILDEMPKGRQKIITRIVEPNDRHKAYEFTPTPKTYDKNTVGSLISSDQSSILKLDKSLVWGFMRQEIKKGRQVFVVCPRIERTINNSQLTINEDIKSVKTEYKKLSEEIFPEFKIDMLHGKLKSEERERVLRDFKDNKTNIIVSTSVIEVGIDMPNASIMVIEGAERFGLAQLHQFRGRVGRGEHQSYCFLFTEKTKEIPPNPYLPASRLPLFKGKNYPPLEKGDERGIFKKDESEISRLEALVKCGNGFELAEKDLAIRGAGEIYGTKQWGISDQTARLLTDVNLIKSIRASANWLVKNDPELIKYPLLAKRVSEFRNIQHLE